MPDQEAAVATPSTGAPELAGEGDGTEQKGPADMEGVYAEGAQHGFNLRNSKLGKAWYQALKNDPELAKEYKALGRSYEAQGAFRKRWAANCAEKIRHERTQTQSRAEADEDVGVYHSLKVIEQLEHDPEAAANYAAACEDLARDGITFRGKSFKSYNPMTKKDEFLYVKSTFRSTFENLWQERANHDAVPETLDNASAAAPTPEKAVQPRGTDSSAAAAAKKGGSGSGGAVHGAGGVPQGSPRGSDDDGNGNGNPRDPAPPTPAPKRQKTEMERDLASLKALKARWTQAHTEARHLLETISDNDEWAFARPAKDLNSYLGELQTFRLKNAFWESWSLQDTSKLRKLFSERAVQDACLDKGALQQAIDRVEAEVACIKASYHARKQTLANRRK
jgi:hypothetical protein